MALRRFEFQDGVSNKFWEIEVFPLATKPGTPGTGWSKLWRRWGKMGTQGQTSVLEMSVTKALDEMHKLIEQKLEKGYHEVKPFGPSSTAPEPAPKPKPSMTTVFQHHQPDSAPAAPPPEPPKPMTLEEIRARFKA